MTTRRAEPDPASFRDPAGFVYRRDGVVYRQVQRGYSEGYAALMASGLYDELVAEGALLPHVEESLDHAATGDAHAVLRPAPIPFVTYPYEWSFSQLRDAALLTLDIQRRALDRGLWLKDASAYNVQLVNGRPVFIDTLSFDRYAEPSPWPAYRQFCQHFLGPLLLMSRVDVRLQSLLRDNLDGVPLDLTSALLPRSSWMRSASLVHVHLHARSVRGHERPSARRAAAPGVSRRGLLGILSSLESATRGATWTPAGTQWGDYAPAESYSGEALAAKEAVVRELVSRTGPRTVWDLGANVGAFSRAAAQGGALVVSIDADHAAVERNYRQLRADGRANVLPLLADLMNPPPALGWANAERRSLLERGPADVLLALALVHHLAIGQNVPLERIATLFASLAPRALVEFVPKSDPQTRRLLAHRPDVFPRYTEQGFELAFERSHHIREKHRLSGSQRILYVVEAR